jgi:hypothetical protein
VGDLILGRQDDGTLEVLRADDEITLDEDLLADMPTEGDYRLDGKLLKIDASSGSLAYQLTDYDRDTHVWHAVLLKDHT